MSRRPVDLAAVRKASRELDELARNHPEAFAPDRLPTTPEAIARALRAARRPGRPPSPDPTIAVAARLPRSVVAALDAIVTERRRAHPGITRQDILRDAVGRYLAAEKRKARRIEMPARTDDKPA